MTNIYRTSDIARTKYNSNLLVQAQYATNRYNKQLASGGLKGEHYQDLGTDAEQYAISRAQDMRNQSQKMQGQKVYQRLKFIDGVMSSLSQFAETVTSEVVYALNDDPQAIQTVLSLGAQNQQTLQQLLNEDLENIYVFGNGALNGAVDFSLMPIPSGPSAGTVVPDTSFYIGGINSLSTRLDDNQTFYYGISADNFQWLSHGIAMLLSANNYISSGGSFPASPTVADVKPYLQEALNSLNQHRKVFSSLYAQIGQQFAYVDRWIDQKAFLNENIHDTAVALKTGNIAQIMSEFLSVNSQMQISMAIAKKVQQSNTALID